MTSKPRHALINNALALAALRTRKSLSKYYKNPISALENKYGHQKQETTENPVSLVLTTKDLTHLRLSHADIGLARKTLVKDMWLRLEMIKRKTDQLGWKIDLWSEKTNKEQTDIEIDSNDDIQTDIKINSNDDIQTDKLTSGHVYKVVDTVWRALKGVITPSGLVTQTEMPHMNEYGELIKNAIKNGYINEKLKYVYIDVEKKIELSEEEAANIYASKKNEESLMPHPGRYSIPVNLFTISNTFPEISNVSSRFTVDRIELLSGLNGFIIDKNSDIFKHFRNRPIYIQHPLASASSQAQANQNLRVYAVDNGPSELTPIIRGNVEPSYKIEQSWFSVIKAVDVHGGIYFNDFVPSIVNTKDINGQSWIVSDKDPNDKCRVFSHRQVFPISLINQAVYDILTKKYESKLILLPNMDSKGKNYIIPGVIERVLVKSFTVNAKTVWDKVISKDKSLKLPQNLLDSASTYSDISLTKASHYTDSGVLAWKLGLSTGSMKNTNLDYIRSSTRIEGRTLIRKWALQAFQEAGASEGPIVFENDSEAFKKLLILYALKSDDKTLGGRTFFIPKLEEPKTLVELKKTFECSSEIVRGVVADTLTPEFTKPNIISFEDNSNLYSLLFHSLFQFKGLTGLTFPLKTEQVSKEDLLPYEKYCLFHMNILSQQFKKAVESGDMLKLKEIMDSAMLLISMRYTPPRQVENSFHFNENYPTTGYKRAYTCMHVQQSLLTQLWEMLWPIYPTLAHHVDQFNYRFFGISSAELPKDILPEINLEDIQSGMLMYKLIDTISYVIETSDIPREEYRGYICIKNHADSRDFPIEVDDSMVALARRVLFLKRLTVANVSFFNFV